MRHQLQCVRLCPVCVSAMMSLHCVSTAWVEPIGNRQPFAATHVFTATLSCAVCAYPCVVGCVPYSIKFACEAVLVATVAASCE
eukprot:11020-Heterococcus_DN1.PRE.2